MDESRASAGEITRLLGLWGQGDEAAGERIWPLLYDELRRIAGRHMAGERRDHSLDPTALVHEAWLRMGPASEIDGGRRGYLALVSRVMRTLLVDHARARNAEKRGGERARVTLHEELDAGSSADVDVLMLNDALERLAVIDVQLARISELLLFGGLNQNEAAEVLGLSKRTLERRWRAAGTWLRRELAT